MKKLNTIFSFVLLSFCLLINVSFAAEFSSISVDCSASTGKNLSSSSAIFDTSSYKYSDVYTIVTRYLKNTSNESYKTDYDTMLSTLESEGINIITFSRTTGETIYYAFLCFLDGLDVGFLKGSDGIDRFCFVSTNDSVFSTVAYGENISYPWQDTKNTTAGISSTFRNVSVFYSSVSIKQLSGTASSVTWDGETYYYKSETDEPDTPTMPTNAEIASAVQMFYNSVYNLPNIAFDDFLVLYDNTTGLYTYIGHTLENALGQVIVEPNGYYEGYKYNVQWWKFFIDETNDNWLDKYSNYYVYTSDGTIDNLKYVGDSNISGLIEKSGPWATSNTVIVYSTNDYPVKYVTFSEDSPDPDIQTGTIQGDQYTYDENLDITDNQYNPLDNFISINYPSTLVGNADFDSFLNTFNENKDVLILPQNANWVILANNSLFSHFSSFIIMCTLFIILQRVMRG